MRGKETDKRRQGERREKEMRQEEIRMKVKKGEEALKRRQGERKGDKEGTRVDQGRREDTRGERRR